MVKLQTFEEEKKICSSCKKLKPLEAFYKQAKRRESFCKACKKQARRQRNKDKKEKENKQEKVAVETFCLSKELTKEEFLEILDYFKLLHKWKQERDSIKKQKTNLKKKGFLQ